VTTSSERADRYRAAEQVLWRSIRVEPSERKVHLPRLAIGVRVQELGSGPPILFIHGASTCGTSWADLAALLPDFRCILLDRPGTGLSDPLRAPIGDVADFVAYADALIPDVLDALEIQRAHLVTTSFGGYFGFKFALLHADRVGRIVELGWSAGARPGRLPLLMRLGSTPPFGRLLARLPANDASVRRLFREIGLREAVDAGRVSDEAVASYGALLRFTDSMRNDVAIGGWFLSPATRFDDRLVLPADVRARISTPIRFIWGDRDPFGGPDIAREFVAPFPAATLDLLPGVGHAPWMDDPKHAAELTERFLDQA
jgi:pimeloyl-ACP methyl ester carboxylesterase